MRDATAAWFHKKANVAQQQWLERRNGGSLFLICSKPAILFSKHLASISLASEVWLQPVMSVSSHMGFFAGCRCPVALKVKARLLQLDLQMLVCASVHMEVVSTI